MKILLFLPVIFLSLISYGQNYELFNANSKKLFTTYPTAGPASGIAFDSVIYAGDYTIYDNYTGMDSLWMWSDSCQFWGGNTCIQQNRSLWFGSHIIRDFMNTYTFYTEYNGTLSFNFYLQPGDSSMFYQDSIQEFYVISEGADTATILTLPDSAKYYRIAHYDISGNIIDSPLNEAQIIIGKEMGLVSFFRVDSFPVIEQPVSLAGNLSPAAGLINLTEDMIYDYQTGDEIEYHDVYYQMDGPPWNNYSKYVKQIFLDRSETENVIYYTVDQTTYNADSNTIILDTVLLTISKSHNYGEIPFNKIDQDYNLQLTQLYNADYCGLDLWTYRVEPQFKTYCDFDNCWGDFDIPGPPPIQETVYVCGLGIYYFKDHLVAPPPEGYYALKEIVYFNKNGIECGEDMITGIADRPSVTQDFSIYPNPAKDFIFVNNNDNTGDLLIISNIQGLIIKEFPVQNKFQKIDISDLAQGLYFVNYFRNPCGKSVKMIKF
jgi:hypothetical protein